VTPARLEPSRPQRRALAGALAACAIAACSAGAPQPTGSQPIDVLPSVPFPSNPRFGALVPACPAAPPADNAPCSDPQLECEYGDDWNPYCNLVAVCTTEGTWNAPMPANDPRMCPTPSGLPHGCPASYGRPGPCPSDIVCAYPEGLCACAFTANGIGTYSGYEWACAAPGVGCSAVRPRIGSACTEEGLFCDYSVCGSYGGQFDCMAGVWIPPSYVMDGCVGG
jgi:hypothetical protein